MPLLAMWLLLAVQKLTDRAVNQLACGSIQLFRQGVKILRGLNVYCDAEACASCASFSLLVSLGHAFIIPEWHSVATSLLTGGIECAFYATDGPSMPRGIGAGTLTREVAMKGSSKRREGSSKSSSSSSHFRLRIRGESMKPMYPPGQLVEFRELDLKRETFQDGKDYYLKLRNGTQMVVRLQKTGAEPEAKLPGGAYRIHAVKESGKLGPGRDVMIFRYLNRKFPARLVVIRRDIVRAAVATMILSPVDKEEPPQVPYAADLGRHSEEAGLAAVA